MTRIREEGVAKVTGRAKYSSDLFLPGMAYARVLSSPHAHARVLSIDTSKARALPGVRAVLTAENLAGINFFYGDMVKDEPAMAVGKVRHFGEVVAAVAAVDEATLDEALGLIEVEYDPLPAVTTADQALAPDAPRVHEAWPADAPDALSLQGNMFYRVQYNVGDVERGFAESDEVFEDEFNFPAVFHYNMEPPAVLAVADGDRITVWAAAQGPFGVQRELARVFRLPPERVKVNTSYLGTGFGGRAGATHEVICVALAKKAGVPVKLLSSFSDMISMVCRPAVRARVKTGVKRDGTLVATQMEARVSAGAYVRRSPFNIELMAQRFLSAYKTPNVSVDACCVYTNTSPNSAYRSIGNPQGAWFRETQLDRIAAKLGMDPVELRLKNIQHRGEVGSLAGTRPMDADLPGDLKRLAEAIDWHQPPTPGRGKGLAVAVAGPSAAPPSSALVKLNTDGVLTVLSAGTEMGQGLHTAMRKIAALELGIPVEKVHVPPVVDTDLSPYDRGTGGSRGTVVTGLAVQAATRDVKEQLIQIASHLFNTPKDDIEVRNGEVIVGEEGYSIAEVVRRYFTPHSKQPWSPGMVTGTSGVTKATHRTGTGEILGRGVVGPGFDNGRLDMKPAFWETAMGAAEVEVDRETGLVRVVRYVDLADVGKAFDEQTAEGQGVGAAMQGLGHTLIEEVQYDEEGRLANALAFQYRVVSLHDIPEQARSILVENEDGTGPFGSKGMGEGSIAPTAPAITNAVAQLTGLYVHELPMSPQRLWEALHPPEGGGGATRTKRGLQQEEQA